MWIAILVIGASLFNSSQAFAQSNYEVESESLANDSEAAIEAAEEAKRRAEEEKIRMREAKKTAEREAIRAKKVIDEAKERQQEFEEKESASLVERKQAEARTQVAQEKIKTTTEQLDVQRGKLELVQKDTERVIAERDRSEGLVEKIQDQIAKTGVELKTKTETRDKIQRELESSKIRLDEGRKRYVELKATDQDSREKLLVEVKDARAKLLQLNREWARMEKKLSMPALTLAKANRGVASTKKAGVVKLLQDCQGRSEPSSGAKAIGDFKTGTKFSAEKSGDGWLHVHTTSGKLYMPVSCFKR